MIIHVVVAVLAHALQGAQVVLVVVLELAQVAVLEIAQVTVLEIVVGHVLQVQVNVKLINIKF